MAIRTLGRRNISVKNWNWDKTGRDFQRELLSDNCAGRVKKAALQILRDGQDEFVKSLPSSEEASMPLITGNLHDSIVSVVTDKGRVVGASYTDPVATMPSIFTGKTVFRQTKAFGTRVIGSLAAFNAVKGMNGKAPASVAATLMVTVPYAENPNELSARNKKGNHVGYLDILAAKYAMTMDRAFKLYDYSKDFRWKGGYLTWDIPIGR